MGGSSSGSFTCGVGEGHILRCREFLPWRRITPGFPVEQKRLADLKAVDTRVQERLLHILFFRIS